jgi:hypothetical protein
MFVVPLLMVALVGAAGYTVMHRRAHPATVTAHATALESTRPAPFWPTTIEGTVGVAALVLSSVPIVLVNVIQVPYLSIVTLLVAVVATGVARFAKHDRSTSVLIAFAVAALATSAAVLFFAGEVFIGHE